LGFTVTIVQSLHLDEPRNGYVHEKIQDIVDIFAHNHVFECHRLFRELNGTRLTGTSPGTLSIHRSISTHLYLHFDQSGTLNISNESSRHGRAAPVVAGSDCHGPSLGSIPMSYHGLVQSSTRIFFGRRILLEDEDVSRQSTSTVLFFGSVLNFTYSMRMRTYP
jgi:hypothetical protein